MKRIITVCLLKKYEDIANKISPLHMEITDSIDYLDKNGVNIYGVVVTGPSKEILKLKSEPWVSAMEVGEIRLWNWQKCQYE